jgi:glutaminyl-tRNA synthetase
LSATPSSQAAPATNFIRNIIDADLAAGKHAQRRWSGQPGLRRPAARRRRSTRQNPHALSAGAERLPALRPRQVDLPELRPGRDYGGRCHLRFDDTNPEKEEKEYVDSIIDAVHGSAFPGRTTRKQPLLRLRLLRLDDRLAEYLIESGHAYVDSQSADECAPTAAR